MSVRNKAILHLIRRRVGHVVFDGVTGANLEPGEQRYVSEWITAAALYDDLMGSIDWARVLISAQGRHSALDHPDEGFDETVCADCLIWAVLEDPGAFDPHNKASPYRDGHV